jgi:DNA-binding NarL/FixJ family response regulator
LESPPPPVRVLVVEDDPLDYELTAARLSEVPGMAVAVERAAGYDEGLEAIRRCQHDVYLIDYRLGHRDGVELLREGIAAGCSAPMIVLTGQGNEGVDLAAMRAGAADYVLKDSPDPTSLGRSVRYAVERRRLLEALEDARQRRQQEQELVELARRLGGPAGLTVTARALGLRPLREALPSGFSALVRRFGELLDAALEQRAYKTQTDPVAPELRALAEQVGSVRGGPGDVIDVYTAALQSKLNHAAPAKAQAYVQEGRAMALGLMGYLASYYRSHCVPADRSDAGGQRE